MKTCHDCGAAIHNPRTTIIRHRRRFNLCLDCLLARVPAQRRAVTATPAPVEVVDKDDAWFDDDDWDDAAGFAASESWIGLGPA